MNKDRDPATTPTIMTEPTVEDKQVVERAIKKKYKVEIFKPSTDTTPTGITVFLPGTLQQLDSYKSTYEALVDAKQVVIAFKHMNPVRIFGGIFGGRSHKQMAEDVRDVVKAYAEVDASLAAQKYNLVGHSLGGKVSLMVAAKYDINNINVVLALDPVDDNPQELTDPKSNPQTNLNDSEAKEIHLFQSEKGGEGGIFAQAPSDKNATTIKELYPDKITSLTMNGGAGHMSYRDIKKDEASKEARETVYHMIKEKI